MKKYLMVLLFTAFTFGGCYTVLWEPDDEFPTDESYENTDEAYYEPYYDGPYVNYYYQPWWFTIAPPTVDKTQQRDKETGKIRNTDGGRGGRDKEPIVTTPTRPVTDPVITTPPVSVPGNTGNGGTTTDKPKDNSNNNSGRSGSGSDSSSRNTDRNNDGSRNSDGGRRK